MHIYTYTYTYTYMHIYTYIHKHIYTHTGLSKVLASNETSSHAQFLSQVAQYAPKYRVLIEALLRPGISEQIGGGGGNGEGGSGSVLRGGWGGGLAGAGQLEVLQMKHFIYSTSMSSVTHLRHTLLSQSRVARFSEVCAQDLCVYMCICVCIYACVYIYIQICI